MAFLCIGVLHFALRRSAEITHATESRSRSCSSSSSSSNRSNSIPASKIHIKYEFIRRKICAYVLYVCCELCVVYTPRLPQFMHTSFHNVFTFTFHVACYVHVHLYLFTFFYAYEQSLSRERESALTHRQTDCCPSCRWNTECLKINMLITF